MHSRLPVILLAFLLALSSPGVAQEEPSADPAATPEAKATEEKSKPPSAQEARRTFVLSVVRTATALPQPDPQDRLRVLASAASIASTVDRGMARAFGREGARLEAEMVARGTRPAVSVLASGYADCEAAREFVEMLPAASVLLAEESLMGALSSCPAETMEQARMKVEAALQQRTLAARPLMLLMESAGYDSAWSQTQFKTMFSNLPADANRTRGEAMNFAAMYLRAAPQVGAGAARDAGIRFLEWLNSMDEGGERNLAVNMVTSSMQDILGEEEYEEALRGSVTALSIARTAGQPGEVEHEEYEFVSVLEAMEQKGSDVSEALSGLPAERRAREAAAHGFANGTEGEREVADRYFDLAFAALDEVWSRRAEGQDAPAVIEEVSEAAAHVDPVDALERAQQLDDPTAQAIGMLAVARVVVGQP